MHRHQGKQVSNARIDRMLRELNSDPSSQFFQHLFGLVGLCDRPAAAKAEARPMQALQGILGGAN
jgi:hypothetical protein